MTLRLKEDPREWRTFGLALAGALALLLALLGWRGAVAWRTAGLLAALPVALAGAAIFVPRALRPVYRAGMRFGHALGRVVGGVALAVLFLAVVTPLGLLLRLFGKDLLRLRRPRSGETCWRPARRRSDLDRMF